MKVWVCCFDNRKTASQTWTGIQLSFKSAELVWASAPSVSPRPRETQGFSPTSLSVALGLDFRPWQCSLNPGGWLLMFIRCDGQAGFLKCWTTQNPHDFPVKPFLMNKNIMYTCTLVHTRACTRGSRGCCPWGVAWPSEGLLQTKTWVTKGHISFPGMGHTAFLGVKYICWVTVYSPILREARGLGVGVEAKSKLRFFFYFPGMNLPRD